MSALGDSVVGMMAHYGWAHAVLLFDPDGFSLVSAGVYREKLQAAGVDIVLDQVALDPDYQLMQDIKASGCKIIVTLHYCTQVRKMLLMAKEMDMLSGQVENPLPAARVRCEAGFIYHLPCLPRHPRRGAARTVTFGSRTGSRRGAGVRVMKMTPTPCSLSTARSTRSPQRCALLRALDPVGNTRTLSV